MSTSSQITTRGLVERLTPLVGDRPLGERLFIIALLERGSADRYRKWASRTQDGARAQGLHECARREDEIAALVHERFAAVIAEPADLKMLLGVIQKEVGELFGGRTDEEQYRIQAIAERGGEGLWKGLAGGERDRATRDVLLRCADLEAKSAEYLESLLG